VRSADKQRENAAALLVLPDLLSELDALAPGKPRWLSLVEGALVGAEGEGPLMGGGRPLPLL
jgi:hypothetical protein